MQSGIINQDRARHAIFPIFEKAECRLIHSESSTNAIGRNTGRRPIARSNGAGNAELFRPTGGDDRQENG
jgi:hypothetical protein